MEERRSGGVDRACEEHETVSEDICCETQHGVAVNAGMLEVDTRGAVCAYNDLQLGKDLSDIERDKFVREFRTLSYHRFVHVPTCTPDASSYVPHKKFEHSCARSLERESSSSKHTTNNASSTTCKHPALCLSFFNFSLSALHVRLFSVLSTPTAFCATAERGVRSASAMIAWRLRRISRSVKTGLLSASSTSNQ